MRKLVSALSLLAGLSAAAQTTDAEGPAMRVRFQFKAIEYCMGSVYNGGFIGLQSGARIEGYLLKGRLVAEAQYNHGWIDIEKLSFPNDAMKPFSDIKVGVRFGKFQKNGGTFRNLHCIDRSEKDGNIITTYYEDEEVDGDRFVGLTGGMYISRAFLKSAFTEESGIEGSVSLNTQSVFIGFAISKMLDNESKTYQSGNVCTWDRYKLYYANVLFAVNHTLGDLYYVGGSPSLVAGSTAYPATPSVEDKLRDFRSFGFIVGFEGGRWRKGFVGNYEVGMIPSLKGKGFFVKIGANFVFGI